MQIALGDGTKCTVCNLSALEAMLDNLAGVAAPLAILSVDDNNYIQTIRHGSGFLIEMRKGSSEQHFEAKHQDGINLFQFDEAKEVFLRYWQKADYPQYMSWHLAEPHKSPGWVELLLSSSDRHLRFSDPINHPKLTRWNRKMRRFIGLAQAAMFVLVPILFAIVLVLVLVKWITT